MRALFDASPRPWDVRVDETPSGQSFKIVDARGGVVALMKSAGGKKHGNSVLICEAVNHGNNGGEA